MSQSPFKFLDSYTKDDRDIFFGREREIEELYQRVFDSKTLVIYGISGTGKTSLINCGLANKFNDADWLPISIRRGKDIIQSLTDELNAVEGAEEPRKAKSNQSRILKSIRSIYLDHFKPIYLLFDQFEEIFIFGTKEERKEFSLIIKSISESDLSCKFLFSIREEYLASLTELEKYIPNILQNRFRVERMNRQNAISVIEGPCKKFGISVEEGFSDSLLDKLGEGGANIELTYLQVYLDRLFNLAVDENGENLEFTLELLERTGSITDLLGTFLNEQIAKMENPDVANAILKSFVSAKGTKKQLSIDEATESVQVFNPDAKVEQIREYIVNLVNLRILRGEDEEGRYELRHDSLAAKIFEKISADEMELLEVRQFIENAFLNFKTRHLLLSPDDFTYISNREKLLRLSNELQDFVDSSRENIRVKNRTVKRLTFLSAVALVILLFAVGKYVYDNVNESQSRHLAFLSISKYKNVEHRLVLASMAYEKNKSSYTSEALIRAYNDLPFTETGNEKLDSIRKAYLLSFEASPEPIIHAECTKFSGSVFGYTESNALMWDKSGSIKIIFNHNIKGIIDGKISDDERFVALLGSDSILIVYQINGIKLFSHKVFYFELTPNQSFAFTKRNQIVINNHKNTILIDTLGNVIQQLSGYKEQINAIAISLDSRFIASASNDSSVMIWYFNKIKNEYCLYETVDKLNDIVKSVNFSSNGKMIVLTSDTLGVAIININNYYTLDYSDFFKKGWRSNNNKVARIRNKHFFNAEFSEDDFGIVVRAYEIKNDEKTQCYLGDHFYWDWENFVISSHNHIEFDYLSFNPNSNFYAIVKSGKISLLSLNPKYPLVGNYILFETKGEKCFFSNNGDVLYVFKDNLINQYLISDETINVIANEYCTSGLKELLNPF